MFNYFLSKRMIELTNYAIAVTGQMNNTNSTISNEVRICNLTKILLLCVDACFGLQNGFSGLIDIAL